MGAVKRKCPNLDQSGDELSGVAAVCSSRNVVAELLNPPNGMLVWVQNNFHLFAFRILRNRVNHIGIGKE